MAGISWFKEQLVELPVRFYRLVGTWSILLFIGMSILAGISLRNLTISGDISFTLPPGDPYNEKETYYTSMFGETNWYLLSLYPSSDLFSVNMLEEMRQLTEKLTTIEEIAQVISPITAEDIVISEGELLFKPLYQSMASDTDIPGSAQRSANVFKERILKTPVFRQFFVTYDGKGLNILCIPKAGTDQKILVRKIEQMSSLFSGESFVLGDAVIDRAFNDMNRRDFMVLGAIALCIILAVETIFARSLVGGLLLWVVTSLPAIWTLAFFPPMGLQVEIINIVGPILVLILSTTYVLHFMYYLSVQGPDDVGAVLRRVTPVIFIASGTTILGFFSLQLSPLPILKDLGQILMLGIGIAGGSTLFLLPGFAHLYFSKHPISFATLRLPLERPQLSPVSLILFFSLMGISIVGVFLIPEGHLNVFDVRKGSSLYTLSNRYKSTLGGNTELNVIVGSGQEYGFVSKERYNDLQKAIKEAEHMEKIREIISIIPFVSWINGRLEGSLEPIIPNNEIEIGESLELLSSNETGFGINTLINSDYSIVRFQVRYFSNPDAPPREVSTDFAELFLQLDTIISDYLPDCSFTFMGPIHKQHLFGKYIEDSVLYSFVLFFPLVFFFLWITLRSWTYALLAVIPSLSAFLFFLGLMGYFGLPFSGVSAVFLCCLIGVSMDDAIFLLLFIRKTAGRVPDSRSIITSVRTVGSIVVRTTLIIAGGLMVLLLSNTMALVHNSRLMIIGFFFAMVVTLFVVPVLLDWYHSRRRTDSAKC